jgi:hypothetical protein
VKFGRKPKLSEYQRLEAIAKSYAVDVSMITWL